MKPSMQDRLFRREFGQNSRYSAISGLYGDKSSVENLDIVNELGGHSGCVNALSWSSSGRLLASGSDDQHLNIHSYQPESSTAKFALNTTVSTGHSANIFSVKFMPHSSDRTVVTCAGDFDVRVFDIENSGRSTIPGESSNPSTSSTQLNNMYKGVQYLSHGDTNTRVYRSHTDRVKRIVTESSPFLFLYVIANPYPMLKLYRLRSKRSEMKFPNTLTFVENATDSLAGLAARMARYLETDSITLST
ncbi:MAG: hypothetical protein Q9174_001538 [Haloplaca sp. 1 TL-2023]